MRHVLFALFLSCPHVLGAESVPPNATEYFIALLETALGHGDVSPEELFTLQEATAQGHLVNPISKQDSVARHIAHAAFEKQLTHANDIDPVLVGKWIPPACSRIASPMAN